MVRGNNQWGRIFLDFKLPSFYIVNKVYKVYPNFTESYFNT
ncbi:hypothetical protein EMIT079MI2_70028 [Bacillus sp. IT-79MI2]